MWSGLAEVPPPFEIPEFNAIYQAHHRQRRSVSTDDDDDETWPSDTPSSPDESSRTTSWKRKRLGFDEWSAQTAAESSPNLARLALERSRPQEERRAAATADLEAQLKEAQQLMAQMACALACSPATHECSLCAEPIAGSSAVGGGCLCHFCHPFLSQAVANGLCACPKCGAEIVSVKRDLEFDALLASRAAAAPSVEDVAAAAMQALAGPGRVISVDEAAQLRVKALAKGEYAKGEHARMNSSPTTSRKVSFSLSWPRKLSWPKKR